MRHYTKEELEAYRRHTMSLVGRMKCTLHLSQCHQCAQLLQSVTEDDALLDELRECLEVYGESLQITPSASAESSSSDHK